MRFGLFLLILLVNIAHSANFHVEPKYITTGNDFNQLCADDCPVLNYGLISTNDLWVQHIINTNVLSVFGSVGGENSPQDLLYKEFAKIGQPTDKQLTDFLKQSELNIIQTHQELINNNPNQHSSLIDISARPNYLGHQGDLELFSISEFYQVGDMVGTGSINYFVFDMIESRQLTLDDILLPNTKEKLENMVKEKFFNALKKGKVDIKKHEKKWSFFLTKNFIFTKDGIKFLYQPEQITPYNMGMPEFVIGYADLKNIVKPEYLK